MTSPISLAYDLFSRHICKVSDHNCMRLIDEFLRQTDDLDLDSFERRMVQGWSSILIRAAFYKIRPQLSPQYDRFLSDLFEVLDRHPSSVIRDEGEIICGKIQPSIYASVDATVRRLLALDQILENLDGAVNGVILGGSLSYVPFLGIRHDTTKGDYSDIDILMTVEESFFEDPFSLPVSSGIFREEDEAQFRRRKGHFVSMYQEGDCEVMSQKFTFINDPISVSAHIVTDDIFIDRFVDSTTAAVDSRVEFSTIIRDYRATSIPNSNLARHSFDGSRLESSVSCSKVAGGAVHSLPHFDMQEGKFYPGPLYTVITPTFDLRFDRHGTIKAGLGRMRSIFTKERNEAVYGEHPNPSIVLAHNRTDIFPLGAFYEGQNLYLSPAQIHRIREHNDLKLDTRVKEALGVFNDLAAVVAANGSNQFGGGRQFDLLSVVSSDLAPSQSVPNAMMRTEGFYRLQQKFGKLGVRTVHELDSSHQTDFIEYSVVSLG